MSKLNILLATYGKTNQAYLDKCLRSIEAQTYTDYKVILVSSGDYWSTSSFPSGKLHRIHSGERWHFPKAIHEAYKSIDDDCELICILNDDVILNSRCLETMAHVVNGLQSCPLIVNPSSNCDQHRAFLKDIKINGVELNKQQFRINEIGTFQTENIVQGPYNAEPMLIFRDWTAFYCTMMKRSTWETVGGIDPNYKTGQDDLDFCLRASKLGIRSAIVNHAFAFHFSGVAADQHLTDQDRSFNVKYFNEKMAESSI